MASPLPPRPSVPGYSASITGSPGGGTPPPPQPAPAEAKKGLRIPWYSDQFGEITRRSQYVLLPTKVEQVTPKPRIDGGVNLSNPIPPGIATGVLPEAYTGKSRDQAATMTGQVYKMLGQVWWNGTDMNDPNTEITRRVFASFRIVTHQSGEQLIVFDEPIYQYTPGGSGFGTIAPPVLILETSAILLDPESDAPLKWEMGLPMGGPSGIEWWDHPDIQVGIVGIYDDYDNLLGWKYADGDLEFANQAGQAYLEAHAVRYRLVNGEVIQYPFILPWQPDGAVQQITWSMGPDGPTTVASINNEHSAVVLPYSARRRAELLPPNKEAAAANAAERKWVDEKLPKGGGNPR